MRIAVLLLSLAAGTITHAETLDGRWDGTIAFANLQVPFRMQIAADGPSLTGSFLNGPDRVTSTSGTFADGMLRLSFEQYGSRLEAKFADGALKGAYGGGNPGTHAFEAALYCSCAYEGEAGPDISGVWEIPFDSSRTWRLTVRREGEETFATIRRGEHETGTLSGRFDGLQFTLHHFDGEHAYVLDLEPRQDGSLAASFQEPGQPVRKSRAVKARTVPAGWP
jgi:hypothetical protein